MYRFIICLSLVVFPLQHTFAESNISISPGIMYFNYEEFDLNNVTLDTEIGFIPGISFLFNDGEFSLGAHIFSGEVEYDGQTQAGAPHKTDTDESLYYLFYRHDFPATDQHNIFIGINYQLWERFIQANNGVGSLYEEYSWWSAEAGIKLDFNTADNKNINFELAGFRTFNGDILIDLNNFGYGQPTLNLGDKFGIRSLLSLELKSDNYTTMQIGVEYKYWGFGRSNTETLSNGINTISIVEPESTSNLLRFFINFTQSF